MLGLGFRFGLTAGGGLGLAIGFCASLGLLPGVSCLGFFPRRQLGLVLGVGLDPLPGLDFGLALRFLRGPLLRFGFHAALGFQLGLVPGFLLGALPHLFGGFAAGLLGFRRAPFLPLAGFAALLCLSLELGFLAAAPFLGGFTFALFLAALPLDDAPGGFGHGALLGGLPDRFFRRLPLLRLGGGAGFGCSLLSDALLAFLLRPALRLLRRFDRRRIYGHGLDSLGLCRFLDGLGGLEPLGEQQNDGQVQRQRQRHGAAKALIGRFGHSSAGLVIRPTLGTPADLRAAIGVTTRP